MTQWIQIAKASEALAGGRKLCEVGERRIALLRAGDEWIAIDNYCPHRGGPVGAGPITNGIVTCPWHGLSFEVASGRGVEQPTVCLTRLPLRVVGDAIEVDVTPRPKPTEVGIFRYLVRYSAAAHVGRFGSVELIACQRGNRVLVATERGQEVGELLVAPGDYAASDERAPAGELLRAITEEDAQCLEQRWQQCDELLKRFRPLLAAATPPVAVLEAELTFDGGTMILYHVGEASAALGPLAVALGQVAGDLRVQFAVLSGNASRKTAAGSFESAMRGPYERLKYDFRRVWECPVCRHRERTSGATTSMFCGCQAKETPAKQTPMKLIEDGAAGGRKNLAAAEAHAAVNPAAFLYPPWAG